MSREEIQKGLKMVADHLQNGSSLFVRESCGTYHRFSVCDGKVMHDSSHGQGEYEHGCGVLPEENN